MAPNSTEKHKGAELEGRKAEGFLKGKEIKLDLQNQWDRGKKRSCKMNGKHRVKVQRPTPDSIHIRTIPIKGRADKGPPNLT